MDDLISRQAAITAAVEAADEWDGGYNHERQRIIEEALARIPSAERKKGKWVNGKCDQCGEHAPFWPMASTYYRSRFCPNCGSFNGGEE